MCTERWLVKLCSGLPISILWKISRILDIRGTDIIFESSFVENGGDSLSSLALQSALRDIGIDLSFEAILTTKSIHELLNHAVSIAEKRGVVRSSKRKLSTERQWLEEYGSKRWRVQPTLESAKATRKRSIHSFLPEERFPLTDLQLVFVHSSLSRPERNIIQYYETHRHEDILQLKRAWHAVLESEPIFRMRFEVTETGGYMLETKQAHFQWIEAAVGTKKEYDEEVHKGDWEDNLKNGFPVNSFKVVRLKNKSTVIWRVHHALIDEYSRNLLLAKVRRRFGGYETTPGVSFGQFTAQLRLLQCQHRDVGVEYWTAQQSQLADAAATLLLPAPTKPPSAPLKHLELKVKVSELSVLCKKLNVTLATWYYAAWALVLSTHVDSDHVRFGAIFSGRAVALHGVQDTIGPTINSLPLHIHVNRKLSVGKWLGHIFQKITELSSVQWYSPDRTISQQFDTAVNIQLTTEIGDIESSTFGPVKPPFSTIISDVPLQVDIARNGKIRFSYHTDVYSPNQILNIAQMFTTTLTTLRNHANTLKDCLPSRLPDEQLYRLSHMGHWNVPTTREESINTDLVELFVKAARANPFGIAVSQGERYLTYSELEHNSSMISERLSQLINPDDVVCVHADRTINWIVAIYGVLKAGGVYCPLAEDVPLAIKNVNYQTARAKLFLVGTCGSKKSKPQTCDDCLSVEEILSHHPGNAIALPRENGTKPRPNAPAYLCFTSGSTGTPKGVLCRHRGLVAFQSDLEVRLNAQPNWKIAQVMSPNFDGSIHEIFSALSYGSELVLKNPVDPLAHLKAADAAILTPSVAKVLRAMDFPDLKILYLVGEAVSKAVCDAWATEKTVYNMYGPTEATCGATIKHLHARKSVTLGSPNKTTRIYILDENQQLTPLGVIGEICLAGVQVAVGYIGQPDETAKRFLPDTINPHFEEYMYRTGDRGFWSQSGELILLGRNDRQIKYRGFRLDMDDLESRMLQCYPGIKVAAVALKDKQLVAQIQPANINLREFCYQMKAHIPAYAIPQHILAVDEFPITAVGKLDYKKIAAHEYFAVRGDMRKDIEKPSERIVATAVRDILGVAASQTVDLDSTLANLGGHSLLYLRLSHRLSKLAGYTVPLRMILQAPSLRDLAEALDLQLSKHAPIGQASSNSFDESRLSPIELDWWEKYRIGQSSSFNVSYACEFGAGVDVKKLIDAWNTVLERHAILRSFYRPYLAAGVRRHYHQQPPRVKCVGAIYIDKEVHSSIDIREDCLIRVLVSPTRMLVIISHIICDLTTLRILLEEVAQAYIGHSLLSVRKTYSQIQWSIPNSSSHFPFWKEYLRNPEEKQFCIGRNAHRETWEGTSRVCHIAMGTYTRLRNLSIARKITMHQISIAAVALALQHQSADIDIILGAPYLNRNSEDDQNVVGLFLEPLPIRVKYRAGGSSSDSFLPEVQRSSHAALSHAVPWHQLLAYLEISPKFPNHPIFDVMVTFHDERDRMDFAVPDTRPIKTWSDGAKFKLMAEFTADRDDGLSLRLEYSTECFNCGDIKYVEALISIALGGLADEDSYECIQNKLRYLPKQ